MEIRYKRAKIQDLDLLVDTRIEVLRAANRLDGTVDLSLVKRWTRNYYEEALNDQAHIAYLVFSGEEWIGAGGISFFRVMPTYHNPTGWKAYLMNMYTAPAYRRRGIASHTMALLTQEAKRRGVEHISLEATDMGRPLYERFGFVKMEDEMELPVNILREKTKRLERT